MWHGLLRCGLCRVEAATAAAAETETEKETQIETRQRLRLRRRLRRRRRQRRRQRLATSSSLQNYFNKRYVMHAHCPSPCFLDCRPRSLSNVVAFCFRPFAFVICRRRRRRHCRRHCRCCRCLRCLHTIYNVPHFAILILVLIRLLQQQQRQQQQRQRRQQRQQRQQHQLPFPVCALRRVALLIVSNLSASLAAIFHLLLSHSHSPIPLLPILFLSIFLLAVTCVR